MIGSKVTKLFEIRWWSFIEKGLLLKVLPYLVSGPKDDLFVVFPGPCTSIETESSQVILKLLAGLDVIFVMAVASSLKQFIFCTL